MPPSQSPKSDSEENLAFYIEAREFTRSYDTSERAKASSRPDAVRKGSELVFEYQFEHKYGEAWKMS